MSSPLTDAERAAQMCYVGMTPCGCLIAASVDLPEMKRENAKLLGELVRAGDRIERMTVAQVRAHKFGCDHRKARPAKKGGAR